MTTTQPTITNDELLDLIFEAGVCYGKWRARFQQRKEQFGMLSTYTNAANEMVKAARAESNRLIALANERGLN